jgi:hypothetical protein
MVSVVENSSTRETTNKAPTLCSSSNLSQRAQRLMEAKIPQPPWKSMKRVFYHRRHMNQK